MKTPTASGPSSPSPKKKKGLAQPSQATSPDKQRLTSERNLQQGTV